MQNNAILFLSLDEVIIIHTRLIEKFGGASGVRDMGLLESALFRPQTGYYENLVDMASALFESLLMTPPFIDGNKRVAFFSTDIFLRINGIKLEVQAIAAHQFIIGQLESKQVKLQLLRDWIQLHIKKLK